MPDRPRSTARPSSPPGSWSEARANVLAALAAFGFALAVLLVALAR